MGNLDVESVLERLKALDEYMTRLGVMQGVSREEFVSDFRQQWAVQHGLQMAIETMIDVGAHIVSSLSLGIPKDSKDVFNVLAANHILPEDFAGVTAAMVGFRNLIVHEYLKIDLDKVYENFQNSIEDFSRFSRFILNFLKENNYI